MTKNMSCSLEMSEKNQAETIPLKLEETRLFAKHFYDSSPITLVIPNADSKIILLEIVAPVTTAIRDAHNFIPISQLSAVPA